MRYITERQGAILGSYPKNNDEFDSHFRNQWYWATPCTKRAQKNSHHYKVAGGSSPSPLGEARCQHFENRMTQQLVVDDEEAFTSLSLRPLPMWGQKEVVRSASKKPTRGALCWLLAIRLRHEVIANSYIVYILSRWRLVVGPFRTTNQGIGERVRLSSI